MDEVNVSLNLGDQVYDYTYNRKTRTVYTQLFPGVPVFRVFLGCGHSIGHDTLVEVIEERQKVLEELAQSFS